MAVVAPRTRLQALRHHAVPDLLRTASLPPHPSSVALRGAYLCGQVMHARALGYACTIALEATFTQAQQADPEWSLPPAAQLGAAPPDGSSPRSRMLAQREGTRGASAVAARGVPAWAMEVSQAKKSAGAHLATGYLEAAGVRLISTWVGFPNAKGA